VVARWALTTGYYLSRLRREEAHRLPISRAFGGNHLLKNKNAATDAAAFLIT
jgi:hypothetical protein